MPVDRNTWLALSDSELGALCLWDFHRTTGNGGQKKNKTSSAVRVTHKPTGISAVCDGERSQKMNRREALQKLRMALALNLREPPEAEIPAVLHTVLPSLASPSYPLFAAFLLDIIASCGWDTEKAATLLQWSKSRLFKVLGRDKKLGELVNRERLASGLTFLHF